MCDDGLMAGERVLPSGTLTFLFTDIEGSSLLWDQHPIEMREALRQHDAVVAGAISAHDGYVFTTAGDSFAAAFRTAEAAAQAALEIQSAIAGTDWNPATPVRVRIGLHTGEAYERGGDYYGPAVNRTARIEAAGHSQQVLVSGVTASVLAGSTATKWELGDLGYHSLRGLSQPEHIHQLGPGVFPAPRSDNSSRTNLLPGRLSLIGREIDTDNILELCTRERLVTLTGPGGIGKTSLATEVAYRLTESGSGTVWWCDLISAVPSEAVRAISRSIGIEGTSLDIDGLVAALRRRGSTQLVLDNCEHVLDSVSGIVDTLLSGSDVSILATSRHPIGLTSETLFAVAPLDPTGASFELFERVMRRVGAASELDSHDRAVIRSICQRLDGMPLAIELVAARTRALALPDVERRVEQLLATPASTTKGIDERHRTMASTIAWSVDLLDDEMRNGLGALSVFSNGFDFESAEQVLRPEDVDAIDAIEAYVAGSLLEVDHARPTTRYRMLEPVRQYAEANLWRDPARTRDAHLEHFLTRLESAYADLGSHDCRPYLALADDIPDLAACHRWALDSGRVSDDLRLYHPLVSAWMDIGQEVYDWAEETMQLTGIEHLDGWGAAWMCQGSAQIAYGSSVMDTLAKFSQISSDDPSYEAAERGRANMIGVFTGLDWHGAIQIYDGPAPNDTVARLQHYFFGGTTFAVAPPEVTGLTPTEAVDKAVDRFYEGLGWAAAIGAVNYEASLHQIAANILVRNRRLAEGVEEARMAEELAESLDMAVTRDLSRYHHIIAALLGHEVDRDPFDLLVETLASTLVTGHRGVASYLVKVAPRYFASAGEFDMAALCMLQPDVGFPDILPDFGITSIPEDAWNSATEQALSVDTLDVASRALNELNIMHPPPPALVD